jgi:hypothetical protein
MCLPQVIESFQNYRGVATTFYTTLVYSGLSLKRVKNTLNNRDITDSVTSLFDVTPPECELQILLLSSPNTLRGKGQVSLSFD